MRNEPWRDKTRSEAERADWDKARYEGAEPYIGKLEAEIDRLTARCAALERALKTKMTACGTCKKKPDLGYCAELYDCINDELSYPCWDFDESQFTAKEDHP